MRLWSSRSRLWRMATLGVVAAVLLALAGGGVVFAAQGTVWTTLNSCGAPQQDINHYSVGDWVYVNTSGLESTQSYTWEISGKPGGASCDPGSSVATGTVSNPPGGAFCIQAYKVQPDDCGEYGVNVKIPSGGNVASDNYRIEPTPVIPEVPWPVLFPLSAAVVLGGYLLWQRKGSIVKA